MSGQEPGYVPPDHKTTAEFAIPGKAADDPESTVTDPESTITDPESTMVDQPVDDVPADLAATSEDLPEDDVPAAALPEDDVPAGFAVPPAPSTVTDFSVDATMTDVAVDEATTDVAVEAPQTLTDVAVDEPATVTDVPVDDVAETDIPVAGANHMPPPVVAASVGATAPQAADQPVAGAQEALPDEHDLWTAHFGAQEELQPAPPPVPYLAPPTPDVHQQPAASHQPPPPPQAGPGAAPQQGGAPPQQFNAPPPPGPGMPVPGPGQAAGRRKSRRPLLVAGVAAAVLVVGLGATAAVLLNDVGSKKSTSSTAGQPSTAASASPSGPAAATPSPTTSAGASGQPTPPVQQSPGPTVPTPTAPPAGPVVTGNGITYQLMQSDPGYYEGRMVFTNRTGKPMKTWKITFDAPGGNVKNIWGGRLVRKGEHVEIQNLKDAPPVPPGATWEVQYGASGAPADPKGCKINGKPCGF